MLGDELPQLQDGERFSVTVIAGIFGKVGDVGCSRAAAGKICRSLHPDSTSVMQKLNAQIDRLHYLV